MAKRGPAYPAFGLKEAIEKARRLFDQDGRALTTPDVAVRAWGYNSLNGASLRVLAALKHFGLLESAGDNVRLTDRALAILLEPAGPSRSQAIQEAADAPDVFSAMMAEYGDQLPSSEALISYLVRKHGFHQPAAQRLVDAFRETRDLVAETPVQHITPNEQPQRQAGKDQPPADRRGGTSLEGRMEFNWPLSGDAVATLTVTKALDLDDLETLTAYFEIAKKALAKAAAKRQTPEPQAEA